MAFGYWIRRAHLKVMSKDLDITPVNGVLCARGKAFHIAPANVDTIFFSPFLNVFSREVLKKNYLWKVGHRK